MEIKLEQFEQNPDPSKPSILGWARVNLNEKMYVWMTVLKGAKGVYIKFPSVKLNGEFEAAIAWPGQNVENKIRDAVMPELTKKLEPDTSSWL